MQQAPKPSISARHSGCFYKSKYSTPQKKLVDKSCRKWRGKAGLVELAFLFQFTLPISFYYGHEVLQATKQPDEREIPLFPSVCSALLPVVKVWEISSLLCSRNCALCSRNCALRAAEDVAYTILYIASLGTARTGNSNQIINLKTLKRLWKRKKCIWLPRWKSWKWR